MNNVTKAPAELSRDLSTAEIDLVSGGMKWTRGTKNSDVIDARGGSMTFLGLVITFDAKGNPSSVRPA